MTFRDPELKSLEPGLPELLELFNAIGDPVRIQKGIWTCPHHNFNHLIAEHHKEYPFSDALHEAIRDHNVDTDGPFDWEAHFHPRVPRDYGVIDSPNLFLEMWGDALEKDDRIWVVAFTPVYKDAQPPHGGWRWHKWGPYFGIYKEAVEENEYLYDTPGVDVVYCFHLIELFAETIPVDDEHPDTQPLPIHKVDVD